MPETAFIFMSVQWLEKSSRAHDPTYLYTTEKVNFVSICGFFNLIICVCKVSTEFKYMILIKDV